MRKGPTGPGPIDLYGCTLSSSSFWRGADKKISDQMELKALDLYREAASLGHAKAGYELMRLYLQGNTLMGVEKNVSCAKKVAESTLAKVKDLSINLKADVIQLEALKDVTENLLLDQSQRFNF